MEACARDLQRHYPFLADATARRLVRSYGTLAPEMLGDAQDAAALGRVFGADLSQREVDWLVRTEWAQTAEDMLWRRSKLGLRFSAAETEALAAYLARRAGDGGMKPGGQGSAVTRCPKAAIRAFATCRQGASGTPRRLRAQDRSLFDERRMVPPGHNPSSLCEPRRTSSSQSSSGLR